MEPYAFEKLRVLLVDDCEYMLKIVGALLESMGVKHIVGLDSPSEVLRVIERWTPDLVIMDQVMEPVTGLELIRQIRHGANRQRFTPIVLLTGRAHAEVVTSARFQAGADAVLVKPVSIQRLHSCIVAIRESDRTFVRTAHYFGPDRRVRDRPFEGENRRQSDDGAERLTPGMDREPVPAAPAPEQLARVQPAPAPAEDPELEYFEIDV